MRKTTRKGSIGAKIIGTMMTMIVIIVLTIVADIGALWRIGEYNGVIGDTCLALETDVPAALRI